MQSFKKVGVELSETGKMFEGYTNGKTWNGWLCPYFTKEVADQLVTELKDVNMPLYYDSENNQYFADWGDIEEKEIFEEEEITVDGQTIKVFGIGYQSWCWEINSKGTNEVI